MMKPFPTVLSVLAALCIALPASAQLRTVVVVTLEGDPLPDAAVSVGGRWQATDRDGKAAYRLSAADSLYVEHPSIRRVETVIRPGDSLTIRAEWGLYKDLEQVVVTATRSHLDRRESPIAVQVLGQDLLEATQSMSVAEGLSFRPGLRMEYNCQNCGFSQVRLNGLEGPYSQVLVDGRPMVSALGGVYGLEQIPVAMIERVEVVRGGGSSLYGANAIAGTINLITREAAADEAEWKWQTTLNGGRAPDHLLQGYASRITSPTSGLSGWVSGRYRAPFNAGEDLYDRDGDGIPETRDDFSEITRLRSAAMGARYWNRPSQNRRWQLEGRGGYEHRRGGNRFDHPPQEADIAEQLVHRSGALHGQYEWTGDEGRRRFGVYGAVTATGRSSYYGAGGNHPDPAVRARASLFFGETSDAVANLGAQYGWRSGDHHVWLAGIDFLFHSVDDELPGYRRRIDQSVATPAAYIQYRWLPTERWTILAGSRYDRPTVRSHHLVGDDPGFRSTDTYDALNPRLSILYKANSRLRFRTGYATGFRAPQAFDEDLHLSLLGGAARIVRLDPALSVERSGSYQLGIEQDHRQGKWQGRSGVDLFRTQLRNPFVDQPFTGAYTVAGDTLALFDTKVNDPAGAFVAGLSFETQWSHPHWSVQAGWTWQSARYGEDRAWYPGASSDHMLRAPGHYGYALVGFVPGPAWRADLSAAFTGPMLTPNERLGTLVETPFFADLNLSLQRNFPWASRRLTLETGVYNLLNAYQSDIEVGWERDAGYFYGPFRPRSFFLAVTLGRG
ncbi:MAG: hypothetical protein RLY31_1022 [Bacteroidota bacterium]|jgi:outer membrane receptor for ferrienterochelin and colicins